MMPRLGPRRLLGLVALAAAVALAGCMRVERALVVQSDGSGSYVLALGFREPTPGDPGSVSQTVVTPMEAFGAHVLHTGGTYRRYEDQGYAYWAFTRPFSSVNDANAFLQDDPRPYDPHHSPLLYHDSLRLARETGLGGTTLRVTGAISLADPFAVAKDWKDATETVAVTMPAGIISSRGGVRAGDTVTYTIRYNQTASVDVTGRSDATGGVLPPPALLVGEAAFAILALILTVVGVGLLRRAGRRARRPVARRPA